MMDNILASEEYIIKSGEEIAAILHSRCRRAKDRGVEEGDENQVENRRQDTLDQRYQFEDKNTGDTALHIFNDLVHIIIHIEETIEKCKNRGCSVIAQEIVVFNSNQGGLVFTFQCICQVSLMGRDFICYFRSEVS